MKIRNVGIFTYDFAHKKTQDFIFNLLATKYNIKFAIAAPKKKVASREFAFNLYPVNRGLMHPKILCKNFGIPYFVSEHNSTKTLSILSKNPVDLMIVCGAKILSSDVVTTSGKVLNIHPGLIPEARGLDTIWWSIYYNIPIGVSAHLIGKKIDSGYFICKRRLPVYSYDNLRDIYNRLMEFQVEILLESLDDLKSKNVSELVNLDNFKSSYNSAMSLDLQKQTLKKFPKWILKYAKNVNKNG